MRARLTREARFAVAAALLLLSISAYRFIPFGPFLGLDFQNLFAFHHCGEPGNDPYLATGAQCQDAGNRDMFYPPLLYWAFAWVRGMEFAPAYRAFAMFIFFGLFAALLAWLRREDWERSGAPRLALFLVLLMFQFPVLFAVERGNNDLLVVLGWTAALALWSRGLRIAAGLVAGLVTAAKLYPLFAAAVLLLALLIRAVRDKKERRALLEVGGAYAAAGLVSVAIFFTQTREYLADELPRFSQKFGELALYSHNVQQLALDTPWVSWVIMLPIFAVWVWAAVRFIQEDPVLVFAGSLALSTYFARTSFDYNLITALPLLFVLFARGVREERPWLPWALLILGLCAITLDRGVFAGSISLMKLRIALQCAWLFATGAAAKWLATSGPSPSGTPGTQTQSS